MSEYQIIIYGAATLLALLLFVMLMLKSVKFRKLELQQAQKDVLLTENEKYISELKERCSIFAAENSQLLAENTKLKSDNENQKKYMEYKLADLEKNKDEMSERFKNVSNEVIQTQHRADARLALLHGDIRHSYDVERRLTRRDARLNRHHERVQTEKSRAFYLTEHSYSLTSDRQKSAQSCLYHGISRA